MNSQEIVEKALERLGESLLGLRQSMRRNALVSAVGLEHLLPQPGMALACFQPEVRASLEPGSLFSVIGGPLPGARLAPVVASHVVPIELVDQVVHQERGDRIRVRVRVRGEVPESCAIVLGLFYRAGKSLIPVPVFSDVAISSGGRRLNARPLPVPELQHRAAQLMYRWCSCGLVVTDLEPGIEALDVHFLQPVADMDAGQLEIMANVGVVWNSVDLAAPDFWDAEAHARAGENRGVLPLDASRLGSGWGPWTLVRCFTSRRGSELHSGADLRESGYTIAFGPGREAGDREVLYCLVSPDVVRDLWAEGEMPRAVFRATQGARSARLKAGLALRSEILGDVVRGRLLAGPVGGSDGMLGVRTEDMFEHFGTLRKPAHSFDSVQQMLGGALGESLRLDSRSWPDPAKWYENGCVVVEASAGESARRDGFCPWIASRAAEWLIRRHLGASAIVKVVLR